MENSNNSSQTMLLNICFLFGGPINEAYIPHSGLYIEKDLSINEEIEKLRLSTSSITIRS